MNGKLVLTFLLLCYCFSSKAADPAEGKKLFQARCASCHNVNKKLTGPALAGVDERHSEAWIINFVKASQSMVKAGDKEALAVYNANNQVAMPDHPDLSDEMIRDILAYVKEEAGKAPQADDAPFSRPGQKEPNLMPLSIYNFPFMIAYILLVVIIIILLVFLVNVKGYEHHMEEKQKE
ncbi:Cytochrome c, mono-and diheme variants [Chitinophaga eiseniae]|uniref:Cytochrome c, mono-and diheme variants n=1 Tax=Chitinophaga eiseniae TaxID=634771 RepID=A0A1T4T000_9BACT|nr:cytochrome c [Chitinophaga eiseniae]SKA33712.1 Cytochrome c, mono-and diheme variants [Chitinophaga eiseniae]